MPHRLLNGKECPEWFASPEWTVERCAAMVLGLHYAPPEDYEENLRYQNDQDHYCTHDCTNKSVRRYEAFDSLMQFARSSNSPECEEDRTYLMSAKQLVDWACININKVSPAFYDWWLDRLIDYKREVFLESQVSLNTYTANTEEALAVIKADDEKLCYLLKQALNFDLLNPDLKALFQLLSERISELRLASSKTKHAKTLIREYGIKNSVAEGNPAIAAIAALITPQEQKTRGRPRKIS